VPTGSVEQQSCVGAAGDLAADLVEMGLHGRSVGIRHGQACTDTTCGADGTEQVGALVALVRRLAGSCTAPGPLAHDTVLLADPSFILEPDFDRFVLGQMRLQRGREVFLKAAIVSAFWPG